MNFGGFDAGKYQLANPTQLAINSLNDIFVIDGNDIVVFDQYGNGVSKINVGESLRSIRILFDQMVVCTRNEIYHTSLKLAEPKLNKISLSEFETTEIVSAIMINNELYVLTEKTILVFNPKQS